MRTEYYNLKHPFSFSYIFRTKPFGSEYKENKQTATKLIVTWRDDGTIFNWNFAEDDGTDCRMKNIPEKFKSNIKYYTENDGGIIV